MKIVSRLFLLLVVTTFCTGCASTGMMGGDNAPLTDLKTTIENASPESYASTRQLVVDRMSAFDQAQVAQMGSSSAKVKKAITTIGVILVLGGTISSFVVKDEDLKSSIAQASGLVGGATGIIGLIPMGSGAEKAKSVHTYLGSEISAFEDRWPAGAELTDEQWSQFKGDGLRMIETTSKLGN